MKGGGLRSRPRNSSYYRTASKSALADGRSDFSMTMTYVQAPFPFILSCSLLLEAAFRLAMTIPNAIAMQLSPPPLYHLQVGALTWLEVLLVYRLLVLLAASSFFRLNTLITIPTIRIRNIQPAHSTRQSHSGRPLIHTPPPPKFLRISRGLLPTDTCSSGARLQQCIRSYSRSIQILHRITPLRTTPGSRTVFSVWYRVASARRRKVV